MFGCYASISDVKGVLGISATTDDTVIRKIVESASRSIDQYANRTFVTQSATKYFDGANRLWLPDLLSITTLKTDEDGDATFENTFATTDYITYGHGIEDSLNTYPITRLEISEDSDYGSFASGVKKGVEIATPTGTRTTTGAEFAIGNVDSTHLSKTFDGTIGEVWIYNRILTVGEILRIYYATAGRYQ